MPPAPEPILSVVIVTRDSVATIARLIEHLCAQTARDAIEVVLVGPSKASLNGAEQLLQPFAFSQTLVYSGAFTRGRGTELGVRHARGALIALTEDHSYPDHDWAEHVIDALQGAWAGVGASVRNANPGTAWSRVNHDLSYGRWSSRVPSGEIDDIPGFNSVFRRDALIALGASLEPLLDRITALHRTVREQGGRFAFNPSAALTHWSPSTRLPSVRAWFSIGRCFGDNRAKHEQWSLPRRVMYAVAAPLVVLMRLRSHWRAMQVAGHDQRETLGYYVVLGLLLSAIGFGESYGYVAGEGNAIDYLNDFEFRRDRFLVATDRQAFLAAHRA